MARTTGTRRLTAAPRPATPGKSPAESPARQTEVSSDRYVLPFVHITVPGKVVHFGATRGQASGDQYVMPVTHVKIPANGIDYGIWAALGGAVASEGVTLPIAGALGAGALLRRRSRPPRR